MVILIQCNKKDRKTTKRAVTRTKYNKQAKEYKDLWGGRERLYPNGKNPQRKGLERNGLKWC